MNTLANPVWVSIDPADKSADSSSYVTVLVHDAVIYRITKYPELTKNVIEADYSKGLSEEALNLLIKESRCAVLKGAIEKVTPPSVQEWAAKPAMPKQFSLEGI